MIRIVLVALLLVVMFSGSTSAECAWVLWRNDPRPVEGRPGYVWPQWQIVEAFTGIGVTAGSMLAKGKCGDRRKLSAVVVSEKSTTELVRLPDTLDPRGPKR